MLVLVDFDSLAGGICFDIALEITAHAWPEISISCHLEGLLLTCLSNLVESLDQCLTIGRQQHLNCMRVYLRDMALQISFRS